MHMKMSNFALTTNSHYIAILFSIIAISLTGCDQYSNSSDTGADKYACIAGHQRTLRLLPRVPPCSSDDWQCRVQCQLGDGTACLGLAYTAEKNLITQDEARKLYSRACTLGIANACTNYAANIWTDTPTDEQLDCARRIFLNACDANEPFACGMVGRLLLESAKNPNYSEGRLFLENTCNRVGGFSCRVLAKHLESGKLGMYQPVLIQNLLSRACADGDPDACGKHATASETFH